MKRFILKEFCMSYDLNYLNMDALQEIYAFKFYKVYHRFPKFSDLQTNKKALVWQVKLLSKMERNNEPIRP